MKPLKLTVVEKISLNQQMQRLVLAHPELDDARIPEDFGGLHIKLLFKQPHQSELMLPEPIEGKLHWPPRELKPLARTYSISDYNAAKNSISVDFVKHDPAGIASEFASQCRIGDQVGLGGPGPMRMANYAASHYLFVGDLSAVAAIAAAIKHLPEKADVTVLIELPEQSDANNIKQLYFAEMNHRLEFIEQRFSPEQTLLPCIEQLGIAGSHDLWSITLAGEHHTVVSLKKYFLNNGITKDRLYAVPYWRKDFDEESYHELRHEAMDAE
ncbi:siderophore-interacting protein [Reinekea thalattae]|uniref:Siderophore-interacting protein n=1 Tax=Reinekea thalattae TaxID=2593301 RepID=A0A5C8Z8J7_9GAMM|nr:siderophore-interacting protein [Reinekea thalattae]TXR53664.1 siderophore-interacting protein [Reinekea thalattae]